MVALDARLWEPGWGLRTDYIRFFEMIFDGEERVLGASEGKEHPNRQKMMS